MTTDLRHQLQRSLGATYTLEQELTGGGMSRVFLAHDAQLDRKVVVKVLSPDLAAGVNSERFKREIRLVASLQQANIVPLLAAGETNGLPFYTMPFVEGRSLRDRLAGAPLPITDAVSILRDIARALTYAHEHGVVHRDIKPENVLLSGEAAVVTDFGIARALTRARSSAGDETAVTITALGTAVGTPAYMAPEQASGDPDTDHRADVYAFGCVAFELLTGRPPFHGRTVHEIVTAHIAEPPPSVADLRKDIPAPLAELVARCLEKSPDRRPQSARELLQGLDIDTSGAAPVRTRARRNMRTALIASSVVGAAIATAFFINGRGTGSEAPRSQGALLALVPFANVGGDTAQDFRADGLTDALQIEAKRLPGLTVAARSATSRFRGRRDLDAREVGQALNVSYVLHGTYRTDGRTQRVFARLSRASDGEDIWQDDFDHPVTDIFAAEDDIRRGVLAAIQRHLGVAETASATTSSRGTNDTTAYNLYQRGQFLFGRRGPGVAIAAQLFEQAIARDPNFARAHAGLAAALEILPNFSDTTHVEVHEQATTAARQALALDSTLSEAHTALALTYMHSFQWARADSQFQVAVRHDPGDPAAHMHYARLLIYSGRADEALGKLQRARELDPTSAVISAWLASTLMHNRRLADAFVEIDRALELDSMNPPIIFFGAQINIARGRLDLARRLLDRTPPIAVWRSSALQGYVALGDSDAVRRLLPQVTENPARSFRHSTRAIAALTLVDTARALDEFEKAMDAGEFWPSAPILTTPLVDPVRKSARFAALLRRANLDVSLFTSSPGTRSSWRSPSATRPR